MDLAALYELRKKGLLSEAEFETQKNEALRKYSLYPDAEPSEEGYVDSSHFASWKGIFAAFLSAFKRWKDFKGRTSRFDFWGFHFCCFLYYLLLIAFFIALRRFSAEENHYLTDAAIIFFFKIIPFVLTLIGFLVLIRRFHDVNMRGWWILTVLPIPFIIFLKSNKEANKFGPAPVTEEKNATRFILNVIVLITMIFLSIIVIGGISGFSKAKSKFLAARTIIQITALVKNTQTAFSNMPNHKDIGTPKLMYALGIYTDSICANADCKRPTNLYGGAIGMKATDKGFSLYYTNLPRAACFYLVSFNWRNSVRGFQQLIVNPDNGSPRKNVFTLPPSEKRTQQACSNEENLILWVFQ